MEDEERKALWRQYAQVHAKSQETLDASVRTLAAAGVAVTVTLATALEELNGWGIAAVIGFLCALAFNLVSYSTAQLDLKRRLKFVKISDPRGREPTFWTTCTFVLNVLAVFAIFGAGGLLAAAVATSL